MPTDEARPVIGHRPPIFPERIDVTAANDGLVLAVHDHPRRQPIEVLALDWEQSRKLIEDMIRAHYPMAADEILARLP